MADEKFSARGRAQERMTKLEIRRMVSAAAAACEDKKAENIRILELDPAESGFTDFFLICSGTNDRQNQAIATAIETVMKNEFGSIPNSVEGYRQGEWILMDYVDFVVHIFSTEKREFYDIERLRKTAASMGVEELKASLSARVTAVRKKQAVKKTAAKKAAGKKAIKKAVKKAPAKKAALKKSSRGKAPVKAAAKKSPKKTAKKKPLKKDRGR
jgi:ribosome-associated protein